MHRSWERTLHVNSISQFSNRTVASLFPKIKVAWFTVSGSVEASSKSLKVLTLQSLNSKLECTPSFTPRAACQVLTLPNAQFIETLVPSGTVSGAWSLNEISLQHKPLQESNVVSRIPSANCRHLGANLSAALRPCDLGGLVLADRA